MPRRRISALMVLIAFGAALFGCAASPPQPEQGTQFNASDYPRVFQAAKDVLRDEGFELDRVDARRGVITTMPRSSAGFATPWIALSDASDGVGDLIQNHARAVAVEFFTETNRESADLRNASGTLGFRVAVEVLRASRGGRQVDSTTPRRSSFYVDPVALQKGVPQAAIIVTGRDPASENRLASRIFEQVGDQ